MAKAKHRAFVLKRVSNGRIQIDGGDEIAPHSGYEEIIAVESGRYAIHLSSTKPMTLEDRASAVGIIRHLLKAEPKALPN